MQNVTEKKKRVSILVVEDNAANVFLTGEILSESEKASYEISAIKNGVEALEFLRGTNDFTSTSRTKLIILDLNLPGMHGFDLLARIKTDPELKGIPVCVLTTSEAGEDMQTAKDLNADGYLIKPLDLCKFEEICAGIS